MGLSDIGATLPPGFRFYPNDEELVCHYLHKKIANEDVLKGTLVEVDLHTCEPWQLPEVAKLNSNEWYFFSFRDRKYATGFRTNRATTCGYWKATGKDRTVHNPTTRAVVGMRKTLVFYRNRAPNGIKTGWIMHEFRLENPHMPPKEDWVLCRVFQKSKGENSNSNSNSNSNRSPQNVPESTTASATSPLLADQIKLPCGYCQTINSVSVSSQSPPQQNQSSSTVALNFSPFNNNNHNFLQLSDHHEMNNNNIRGTEINSKCEEEDDDQYGFLFDMSFQESSLGDGSVPPNLDDMRFDDEDNSLVLF